MCIREKMLEYLPDEIPYSYMLVRQFFFSSLSTPISSL